MTTAFPSKKSRTGQSLSRRATQALRDRLAALTIALLTAVPLAVILASFLFLTQESRDIWGHLFEHVLPGLLGNTFRLSAGVGIGSLLLGVPLAWLTGACEFPGRRFFSWALLLPMAVPAYVLAFVFLGLMDFAGPVQSLLREAFPGTKIFFNARSPFSVILVLTLTLYPYVYLLARSAFMTQGITAMEAARTLGLAPSRAFFRVALPMARPWIAGGLMLVLMETLADFGAVSIFNYDTFTTAIYKSWFGFFSLKTAAQLASVLVVLVFAAVAVEQRMRSRMRFTRAGKGHEEGSRIRLTGTKGIGAFAVCSAIFTVAFAAPLIQLCLWTAESFGAEFDARYFAFAQTTVLLASMAAFVTCAAALLLAYTRRRSGGAFSNFLVRLATLGYALPGTVLAVGIFIPVAWLDGRYAQLASSLFGIEAAPLLQGTLMVVLAAYMIRFMAAGFGSVDSAMQRITPSIDEAAQLMGVKGVRLLGKVHVPMLKNGLLTALIIVFVDVMKEMPITLMTRPFGWDTLAVKIFELTSEGEWERAALPALSLVAVGILPVWLLTYFSENRKQS